MFLSYVEKFKKLKTKKLDFTDYKVKNVLPNILSLKKDKYMGSIT